MKTKTAAKVTPGPWERVGRYVRTYPNSEDGGFIIADVGLDRRDEERDANARLISAAPILLDFAKQIRNAIVSGNAFDGDIIDAANAVIGKAEGTNEQ